MCVCVGYRTPIWLQHSCVGTTLPPSSGYKNTRAFLTSLDGLAATKNRPNEGAQDFLHVRNKQPEVVWYNWYNP